jgi:hypothetical protein
VCPHRWYPGKVVHSGPGGWLAGIDQAVRVWDRRCVGKAPGYRGKEHRWHTGGDSAMGYSILTRNPKDPKCLGLKGEGEKRAAGS